MLLAADVAVTDFSLKTQDVIQQNHHHHIHWSESEQLLTRSQAKTNAVILPELPDASACSMIQET